MTRQSTPLWVFPLRGEPRNLLVVSALVSVSQYPGRSRIASRKAAATRHGTHCPSLARRADRFGTGRRSPAAAWHIWAYSNPWSRRGFTSICWLEPARAMTDVIYASGMDPEYSTQCFKSDLLRSWYFPRLPASGYWYLLHKYRRHKFDPMLRNYLHDLRMEQLVVPMSTISVDLVDGIPLVATPAMQHTISWRASISAPGVARAPSPCLKTPRARFSCHIAPPSPLAQRILSRVFNARPD